MSRCRETPACGLLSLFPGVIVVGAGGNVWEFSFSTSSCDKKYYECQMLVKFILLHSINSKLPRAVTSLSSFFSLRLVGLPISTSFGAFEIETTASTPNTLLLFMINLYTYLQTNHMLCLEIFHF